MQILEIINYKIASLPIYKIMLAFLSFFVFLFLRKFFTLVILSFFKKAVEKTKTELDDKFLHAIRNPLRFIFIIAGVYFLFYFLEIKKGVYLHFEKREYDFLRRNGGVYMSYKKDPIKDLIFSQADKLLRKEELVRKFNNDN